MLNIYFPVSRVYFYTGVFFFKFFFSFALPCYIVQSFNILYWTTWSPFAVKILGK